MRIWKHTVEVLPTRFAPLKTCFGGTGLRKINTGGVLSLYSVLIRHAQGLFAYSSIDRMPEQWLTRLGHREKKKRRQVQELQAREASLRRASPGLGEGDVLQTARVVEGGQLSR